MADFFLSNLKSTLDNCITELDEILSAPSKSAFTQQRYKLLPEGWRLIVTLTLFGPSLWQTVVTKVLIPLHT